MKLSRFLGLIITTTVFSLLYVYQQTTIVHLAYQVEKQQGIFQDLLDKNTALRYNIEKNASLIRIGDRISQSSSFQMPENYRLLVLAAPGEGGGARSRSGRENFVTRIFSIRRQAEAGTLGR